MGKVWLSRVESRTWWVIFLSAAVLAGCGSAFADQGHGELPRGPVYTNLIGMKLVRIEPGSFRMGFENEPLAEEVLTGQGQQRNGDFDEHPAQDVEITKPFYIGMYEVTNKQYELFDPAHRALRGKKGVSKGDDEAVVYVNWYEAQSFCQWLSDKEGAGAVGYRLATEAEWEYACRAGTMGAYHTGGTLPERFLNRPRGSLAVGRTPPNAWGLYDMHGNVEEWCYDWYGPYQISKQTDPVGPIKGDFRVTRGGSHSTPPYLLRSSNRLGTIPVDKHELIGFRVVLAPMPPTRPLPPAGPQRYQIGVKQDRPADIDRGPDPGKPYFQEPRKFILMPYDDRGPLYKTHNHFISLTDCPNGDLLAIWHTCITEGERELAVAGSRLRYGKERWEAPSLFWDAPDRNDHGHALWFDGEETIYHFAGLASKTRDVALMMRTSKDNGVTWSAPRLIADHGRSRMPIESVFRAQDGSLVLACDSGPASLWISGDEGLSWQISEGHMRGLHTAVVQLGDGRLMAFSRRGDIDGRMPMSVSADMGASWEHSASDFPPVHLGQRPVVLRLEEGAIFFASFCKNMMVTNASGSRHQVTGLYAAVSLDEGKTWPWRRLVSDDGPVRKIETMDGDPALMGPHNCEQVGYLTVCQTPNRVVQLLSSRYHYAFNLKWLTTIPPAASPLPPEAEVRPVPAKAKLSNVYRPRDLLREGSRHWGSSGARAEQVMSLSANGVLNVSTLSVGQFWLRSTSEHGFSGVEGRKGFTAEIRTQLLKTSADTRGVDLELYDGAGARYTISIKDTGVYWYEGYILGSAFLNFAEYTVLADGLNNTDSMHTYRLTVRPDRVVQIYRDGELIGTRRYEYRTPRKAYMQFGAGAGTEALIDYVAYDLGGALGPD